MEIKNNISFGAKFRTVNILETTTLRCIESESVADLKPIINGLWPVKIKATGSKGYKYFLQNIGEKILNKYPEIANATNSLKNYIANNPLARKVELQQQAKQLIKQIGEEIDITL